MRKARPEGYLARCGELSPLSGTISPGGYSLEEPAWAGGEATMHGIVYIVGLIVIVLAILSFFGLR